jgi:hypothetical protein
VEPAGWVGLVAAAAVVGLMGPTGPVHPATAEEVVAMQPASPRHRGEVVEVPQVVPRRRAMTRPRSVAAVVAAEVTVGSRRPALTDVGVAGVVRIRTRAAVAAVEATRTERTRHRGEAAEAVGMRHLRVEVTGPSAW